MVNGKYEGTKGLSLGMQRGDRALFDTCPSQTPGQQKANLDSLSYLASRKIKEKHSGVGSTEWRGQKVLGMHTGRYPIIQ